MEKTEEIGLSIIIPHYQIPDLLVRCIESIPQREDIQVIVVDDCSEGFEEYKHTIPQLQRPFVEVYRTPEGGSAGRARNVGLEHAKGKWLTFLDADDFLVENFGDIYDKYKESEEDVLYFRSRAVMCDDLSKVSDRNIYDNLFIAYFKTGNESRLRYHFESMWGKIVKRNIVVKNNIRFDEIKYGNDAYFAAAVGVYADKIKAIDEIIYIITQRDCSLDSVKHKSLEELRTRLKAVIHIQELFDINKLEEESGIRYNLDRIRHSSRKAFIYEFFYSVNMNHKKRLFRYYVRLIMNKIGVKL